jgi:hypothetical protein
MQLAIFGPKKHQVDRREIRVTHSQLRNIWLSNIRLVQLNALGRSLCVLGTE